MDRSEVIKHSAVVQIEHKISLMGQQIFNVILANAFSNLKSRTRHVIEYKDLFKYVPSARDINNTKKTFSDLRKNSLQYNTLNKAGQKIYGEFSLISWFELTAKSGRIEYEFPSKLVELVNNPAMYTKINLLIQKQYTGGKYGWFLYELCFDYKNFGKTPKIKIKDLKKFFGIEEGKYNQFKDLNKFVLKPALTGVDKYTDLHISLQTFRTGRVITAVQFFVKMKNDFQLKFPQNESHQDLETSETEGKKYLYDNLIIFGLRPNLVDILFEAEKIVHIQEALQCCYEYSRRYKIISPDGFFYNALKKVKVGELESRKTKQKRSKKLQEKKEEEKRQDIEAWRVLARKAEEEKEQEKAKEEEALIQEYSETTDDKKYEQFLEEVVREDKCKNYQELDDEYKDKFKKIVYSDIMNIGETFSFFNSQCIKLALTLKNEQYRKRAPQRFRELREKIKLNR